MIIPGRPLHRETQRHVARMTVRNDAHIGDLDLLIRGLHDAGIWEKLISLCVAGPNQTDSLLNLIPTGLISDATAVGTPTFTADQGFTLDSNTKYIKTGALFNTNMHNNASAMVYTRTSPPTGSGTIIGCFQSSNTGIFSIEIEYDALTPVYYIGSYAESGVWRQNRTASSSSYAGVHVASRIDSSTVYISELNYVSSFTQSSGNAPTNYEFFVGNLNENGSPGDGSTTAPQSRNFPNQYAAWSVGYGLTSSEMLTFGSLIQAYFTRRGTAV